MQAFIICKNEEANIERCIRALQDAQLQVVALDSGSTDRTLDIAERCHVQVRRHVYVDHCSTYNKITSELSADDTCLIVDADMIVSTELVESIAQALAAGSAVVRAPIQMVWAGYALKHASLYPPKAVGFRGGRSYFSPAGHGEQLASDVSCTQVLQVLVHDDRKPYQVYLANQVRYGNALHTRSRSGQVTWKDRLRIKTPIALIAVPAISYLIRRGFLDGRGGAIYALDRLIAEAIAYREGLVGDARDDSR